VKYTYNGDANFEPLSKDAKVTVKLK